MIQHRVNVGALKMYKIQLEAYIRYISFSFISEIEGLRPIHKIMYNIALYIGRVEKHLVQRTNTYRKMNIYFV